jgi:hypothetical protein
MESAQAAALLDGIEATDLLVLSSPLALPAALERWKAGKLPMKALLLLDTDCWLSREADLASGLPIFAFEYDVVPVAFLAGVAASESSNNASFIAIGSKDDPQGKLWLDAAYAGAKWQSNGTSMMTTRVSCGPDGVVDPDEYREAMARLRRIAGPNFACNHYLVAVGRTTASIGYALSSNQDNAAYVATGWADYRQVRPARFIGCALKHPGAALAYLFGEGAKSTGGEALHELLLPDAPAPAAAGGLTLIEVGLEQGAVGFTDFRLYKQFNPDGEDIEKAVADAQAQIAAGELDVHAMMNKFKRMSDEELSR